MVDSTTISQQRLQDLSDMAHKLRIHAINMTNASNSGHPTSCSSMADVLSVIFFDETGMHFHPKDPKNPSNDKFILSKGHAAPIYYAAWAEAGNFPVSDLLNLRKITSDLEGHPTPRLPFCDVATGSLGQGLGFACGAAYSSKYFDKISNKYFCLTGDGECAEGSVWEAASFASFYHLDNLIAIIDVNRLGQSAPTQIQHGVEVYQQRFAAFGWNTKVIDGHNIEEIINAFTEARNSKDKPFAIISRTFKGKYFLKEVEDVLSWHGKPLGNKSNDVINYIKTLMKNPEITLTPTKPSFEYQFPCSTGSQIVFDWKINYDLTKQVSTREAYGLALKKLGGVDKDNQIIALDADVKNSTFSEYYEKEYPDKFINCFIAEQNLISVGLGVSKRNKIPFCSTFAVFFTRAFDQIRMGAISFANLKFFGSHSGTHIGQDGPSQMGLEDIAMFRTIPSSLVFYPSDAVSTENAVKIAANYQGMVFIKGGRNNHPILYSNEEEFKIGGSKYLRKSDNDAITIVSGGPTLFESLKAADRLKGEGINVRVVDLFCVKPVDKTLLAESANGSKGLVYVVEDNYYEGGLGETVAYALKEEKGTKLYHRAVDRVPRSGTAEELYDMYGLNAEKIYAELKEILKQN